MKRFFAIHRDAQRGTHLHLVLTSHRRTMNEALDELRKHRSATAPNQRPVLFYDFGPGDSDLRRLDKLTEEAF